MKIFIPIKEKSQRVPGKNFRKFQGAPLYKHVMRKFSNHEVYVDTDSEEVIVECQGDNSLSHVTAYKREDRLIGHEVSVCDLIKHFIDKYNIVNPIAQIHVTSPFITPEILEKAYLHLSPGIIDSVVSCNVIASRIWRREDYGFCPVNHNPLKMEQTQDLPRLYEENSAFYIFEPRTIKKYGNRVGQLPYFFEVGAPFNIDIDTEDDWLLAEKASNQ